MHPWHHISWPSLDSDVIPIVVEVVRGSQSRFRLDSLTGMLRLVDVTREPSPFALGIVPRTLTQDGSPVGVILLGDLDLEPLSVVNAIPLGVLHLPNSLRDYVVAVNTFEVEIFNASEASILALCEKYWSSKSETDVLLDFSRITDRVWAHQTLNEASQSYQRKFKGLRKVIV